jgi:hypothetical protein
LFRAYCGVVLHGRRYDWTGSETMQKVLTIRSVGRINEFDFVARGSGFADLDTGAIEFTSTFEEVPPDADPFGSLLAMLIWGTTVFGKEEDQTSNLYSLGDGPYHFEQHIGGEAVSASANGKIERVDEDEFEWSSQSEGIVNIGRVVSVDPFEAVMVPKGPGQIDEYISIPIHTETGRHVVPIVRNISFNAHAQLPAAQLRHMRLTPNISQNSVTVSIETAIKPFQQATQQARR